MGQLAAGQPSGRALGWSRPHCWITATLTPTSSSSEILGRQVRLVPGHFAAIALWLWLQPAGLKAHIPQGSLAASVSGAHA